MYLRILHIYIVMNIFMAKMLIPIHNNYLLF